MSTSLEDALNGKQEETTAPEMEAEAVAETPAEEVTQEATDVDEQPETDKPETEPARDAKGKFTKKDKPAEPQAGDDKAWSYHAYKDEKEKRQAYEQELTQLRAQIAQQPPPQPQAIDPIDDPQGFNRSVQEQIAAVRYETTLQVSEQFARNTHGDEAWQAANAWLMTPEGAATREQAMRSSDPWGEAISAHKRHQAMQEIGDDPQAYRERIEAEIRERLEVEMRAQSPQPATPSTPMPANFASARNAGERKGPSWAGPTSLNAALGVR